MNRPPVLCCDACGLHVPCAVVLIQLGAGSEVEARCVTCEPAEPYVVLAEAGQAPRPWFEGRPR